MSYLRSWRRTTAQPAAVGRLSAKTGNARSPNCPPVCSHFAKRVMGHVSLPFPHRGCLTDQAANGLLHSKNTATIVAFNW